MRYFAKTIQRKLLLILLLVGFLPAVAGVLYVYSGTLVAIDDALGVFLQDRAEGSASAIDRTFQEYFHAAEFARDAAELGEVLEFIHLSQDLHFDSYLITTADGVVLEDDGTSHPQQITIPAGLSRQGAEERPFLVENIVSPGRTNLLFIGRLSGEPLRYLVCTVHSDTLLAATAHAGERTFSFLKVYSNRGDFVNGSEGEDELLEFVNSRYSKLREESSGWGASGESEDVRFLAGFSPSRLLRSKQREELTSVDWIVLARMDVGSVREFARFMLWRNFLFGLLLAPILVLLSWWLTRRFLRPLKQLQRHVNDVAHGNLGARLTLKTHDEIEELADAFNQMTERLDKSHLALEEQMRNVENKARQIALVSNISHAIVGAFSLPRLMETAHHQLRNLLSYDAMTVIVFSGETESEIYSIGTAAFSQQDFREIRLFCEEHLLARSRRPGALPPAGDFSTEPLMNRDFRQFCLLPLEVEKGLMGALVLARKEDAPFAESERRPLIQVSQIIGLAIEHIELYERTRNFAGELEAKVHERAQQLERAHERLLQAERFAATGRLAASIAHEVNNPLGIIKNYLRIIREKGTESAELAADALKIIEEELDRIARIVKGLLDFYRPAGSATALIDMNEEIRSLLPLLQAGFRKKRIVVELDLAVDLPRSLMSQDHIRQVLLNLLKNAEDAVDDEGVITIRTSHGFRNGREFVALEVRDNGCGIMPEDRLKIFEPFYTKKREGQGTGLGLAVTYSIVRNLGGTVEVESEPGKGASFLLTFPLHLVPTPEQEMRTPAPV